MVAKPVKHCFYVDRTALNYLPSKKLILVFTSLFLAVGVVWLVSAKSTPKQKTPSKLTVSNQKIEAVDTDLDGIEDWQEVLAGTDPKDPNSKPTKDQLVQKSGENSVSIESLAPTSKIFETFANIYKNQNSPTTDDTMIDLSDKKTQELFTQQSAEEVAKLSKKLNPYSRVDVVISNTATIRNYVNEVASILQKNFPTGSSGASDENEFTIITGLVEKLKKQNQGMTLVEFGEAFSKIAPFQVRYVNAVTELKKVPTPNDALIVHVGILNSFANTSLALQSIMAYKNDPIIGSAGIKLYSNEILSGANILADIKELIEINKIVFILDEPGHAFQKTYLDRIDLLGESDL